MRGFGELGGGMSATWWSDKHNMHHALTNVVRRSSCWRACFDFLMQ